MGSKYKLDHVNVLPATSKYESYVILYTGFQLWMVKLSMNDFKSHFFTISEGSSAINERPRQIGERSAPNRSGNIVFL